MKQEAKLIIISVYITATLNFKALPLFFGQRKNTGRALFRFARCFSFSLSCRFFTLSRSLWIVPRSRSDLFLFIVFLPCRISRAEFFRPAFSFSLLFLSLLECGRLPPSFCGLPCARFSARPCLFLSYYRGAPLYPCFLCFLALFRLLRLSL